MASLPTTLPLIHPCSVVSLPFPLCLPPLPPSPLYPLQKGEHYHIDDGQDAINNIYACGLIEEINIEPEQDMQVRLGVCAVSKVLQHGFSGD